MRENQEREKYLSREREIEEEGRRKGELLVHTHKTPVKAFPKHTLRTMTLAEEVVRHYGSERITFSWGKHTGQAARLTQTTLQKKRQG